MSAPIQYNWIAANTTYIAPVQSLGAAGSMTLNGSQYGAFNIPGMIRVVSLTSVNNNSAVNFTISGTVNGRTVSETIAGPNNNTVESTVSFDVVTSITTNGAINAVSAGIGHTGLTQWFTCDYNRSVFNLSCVVDITAGAGTITYSFIGTLDDVSQMSPFVFTPIAGMTNSNADDSDSTTFPMRYCAIGVSASTNDVSFRATFLQQGIK